MDRTELVRIEPTMGWPVVGQAEMAQAADDMFGGMPIPAFDIRFLIEPVRSRPNLFVRYRPIRGKGEVSFPGDAIALEGATRTWYGRSIATQLRIGHAQIFNAETVGRHVYFDFRNASETQSIALEADNAQEAKSIFDALGTFPKSPVQAERTARANFTARVQELTPTAWVTYALIAINVLVYVAMCASGVNPLVPNGAAAIPWGSDFGPYTLDGQWWRLFTAMFVHFGFVHIAFNMFVLYQIGRVTERMYGNAPFLALYLFSGLTSSIVSVLWHPTLNRAGASGAIFGVFGALLVFLLKYRKELPASLASRDRNALLIYVVCVLIQGFLQKGVDYGGHVGGLIGGIAIGWPLARSVEPSTRSQGTFASVALALLLACLVLSGLTYPLTHLSGATLAELKFGRVLAALGPAEKRALADRAAIQHRPLLTQPQREDAASEITTRIVPQWDRIYATLDEARLPDHSPRTALRDALLRYADDRRHMERLTATWLMQGKRRNTELRPRIDALQSDIAAQTAVIHKLTGVRPKPPSLPIRRPISGEQHG
ncbi:rhomboid family intramembrane serine protease [Trinickia sp. YCB016]